MKYILPVLAAMATTFLVGLVLYPLVSMIFDQFFHLYLFSTPPADSWKDDLVIEITMLLWILIASAAGGFVCVLLSKGKADFSIFLFIVVSFGIAILFSRGISLDDFETESIIPILVFIGGASTGGYLGLRYKKRKAKLKDNPPSPPDTP